MIFNFEMKKLLENIKLDRPLDPALRAMVDARFNNKDGCYFLAALVSAAKSVTKENFHDRTGYECFVNSIHVEDYDNNDPLSQAIQFVEEIFNVWRESTSNMTLLAIVSADEFSVVVKFHVKRPAERWLSENIGNYTDPVMLFESSEDVIQAIIVTSH
jgi:hypothetical protein